VEEKRTVNFCSRREGGELGEGFGDICICPVDVVIFLCTISFSSKGLFHETSYARQDAVQPIQHLVRHNRHAA
jgi:hypothetical protein